MHHAILHFKIMPRILNIIWNTHTRLTVIFLRFKGKRQKNSNMVNVSHFQDRNKKRIFDLLFSELICDCLKSSNGHSVFLLIIFATVKSLKFVYLKRLFFFNFTMRDERKTRKDLLWHVGYSDSVLFRLRSDQLTSPASGHDARCGASRCRRVRLHRPLASVSSVRSLCQRFLCKVRMNMQA